MNTKILKIIIQILLLAVIAITPFIKLSFFYFPFISGKVYLFRFLVALAFFFWIWLLLKTKREKLKEKNYLPDFKNILVVALILFFLAQIVVSFFGVDPLYSFFSSIDRADGVFQYGFWLFYFLMLVSVFKSKEDWEKLFLVFIVVAFLLSLYSWFNQTDEQFSALFGNPAYFGAFLLFAIGFSFLVLERKLYSGKIPYFLLLAIGFFVLTLLFTYIRGVYLALGAGIFLFCLLSFFFLRKENKKLAYSCGFVLLAGLISLTILFSARKTDFVKNSYLLSRVTQVVEVWEVPSVRERFLNWNIALKAFKEKPVFGWGPENYEVAANKYYDFRIGQNEPWFDRAHSQPFDILATGGITLFAFYLFWIFAVFFLIFKIFQQYKILSFILAAIFLAYLIQGFFLFDTLAVYLGLFPFLAYLVYLNSNFQFPISNFQIPNKLRFFILVGAGIFSSFLLYTTVVVPWRANNLAWQFFNLTEQGLYKETKPYLEKAFSISSPYTSFELRKMTAWQFMSILEEKVSEKIELSKINEIKDLYDFLAPEFEKLIEARPSQPSNYHVLATINLLGFEKLGKTDLEKGEKLLKKAFNYSDLRMEYFNDLAKILLLQGKFEEAEKIIKAYTERMPKEWGAYVPFTTLANFYFEAEKYDLALEYYDKASKVGFQIEKNEAIYPRYMLASEKTGNYQRIVEMAQKYLEIKGPSADTYFNVALGYFYLGDREKAKEFFLKAVELNPEYEQYRQFFIE